MSAITPHFGGKTRPKSSKTSGLLSVNHSASGDGKSLKRAGSPLPSSIELTDSPKKDVSSLSTQSGWKESTLKANQRNASLEQAKATIEATVSAPTPVGSLRSLRGEAMKRYKSNRDSMSKNEPAIPLTDYEFFKRIASKKRVGENAQSDLWGEIVSGLEEGRNINSQDPHSRDTALHYVSECCNPMVVSAFLRFKANPNLSNSLGRNCLHQASLNPSLESFKMIYESMDNPIYRLVQPDSKGYVPIQMACKKVNFAVAQFIIERYPHKVASQTVVPIEKLSDKEYRNLLHMACSSSEPENEDMVALVKLLLKNGVNRFQRDKHGQIPLSVASQSQNLHKGVFETLLNGIEPKEVDRCINMVFKRKPYESSDELMAAHKAMQHPPFFPYISIIFAKVSIECLLCIDDNGRSILHWLSIFGRQPSILQFYHESLDKSHLGRKERRRSTGVEIPILTIREKQLCEIANHAWKALRAREDFCKYLPKLREDEDEKELKDDKESKDDKNGDKIDIQSNVVNDQNIQSNVVNDQSNAQNLQSNDQNDQNLQSNDPSNPVLDRIDSQSSNQDFSNYFTEIHLYDKECQSPLHIAAQFNNAVSINNILNMFGNESQNWKDSKGWNPLHTAAHYNSFFALRIFQQNKWNMEPLDNEGKTPYMIALEHHSSTCVSLFEAYKATTIRTLIDGTSNIDSLIAKHKAYLQKKAARRSKKQLINGNEEHEEHEEDEDKRFEFAPRKSNLDMVDHSEHKNGSDVDSDVDNDDDNTIVIRDDPTNNRFGYISRKSIDDYNENEDEQDSFRLKNDEINSLVMALDQFKHDEIVNKDDDDEDDDSSLENEEDIQKILKQMKDEQDVGKAYNSDEDDQENDDEKPDSTYVAYNSDEDEIVVKKDEKPDSTYVAYNSDEDEIVVKKDEKPDSTYVAYNSDEDEIVVKKDEKPDSTYVAYNSDEDEIVVKKDEKPDSTYVAYNSDEDEVIVKKDEKPDSTYVAYNSDEDEVIVKKDEKPDSTYVAYNSDEDEVIVKKDEKPESSGAPDNVDLGVPRSTYDKLLEELNVQKQLVADLRSQIASLEESASANLKKSTSTQQSLEDQLSALRQSYSATEDSLKQQLSDLKQTYSATEDKLKQLTDLKDNFLSKEDQLKSQITALQSANMQLETDLGVYKTTEAKLLEEQSGMKAQISSLRSEIGTAKTSESQLRDQLNTFKMAHNQQLSVLQEEIRQFKSSLDRQEQLSSSRSFNGKESNPSAIAALTQQLASAQLSRSQNSTPTMMILMFFAIILTVFAVLVLFDSIHDTPGRIS